VATEVFDDLALTEPLALVTVTVARLPAATVTEVGDTVSPECEPDSEPECEPESEPEWEPESEFEPELEEVTVTATRALLSPLRIVIVALPADRPVTTTVPDE
jgi:hypothetical protein